MTNANDALKEFESQGKTDEPSQKKDVASNPTIKLHNGDGENTGLFVLGKVLLTKAVEKATSQGKRKFMFVDMVLEKTNAVATVKDDKAKSGYKEVAVKPGDIVTIFAASGLFNAASRLSPGTRMYASYNGIKMQKGKGVHQHTIKTLPGTLTETEAAYVAAQNKRKEAAADAGKAKAEDEAQAADALSQLED